MRLHLQVLTLMVRTQNQISLNASRHIKARPDQDLSFFLPEVSLHKEIDARKNGTRVKRERNYGDANNFKRSRLSQSQYL